MTNNEGRSLDLVEIVLLLYRWRGVLFRNLLITAIVSAAITLVLPKWYKANTLLLPPKESTVSNPLGVTSTLLRSVTQGARIPGLGGEGQAYSYLAILKSRSAMEAVVRHFNLFKEYDIPDSLMADAVEELTGNVNFEIKEEGTILIEVADRSPEQAADMASYFVEQLNDISTRLGVQEAHDNMEFIGKRVQSVRDELRASEDSLVAYQEKSGFIISVDPNSSGLSAIAELYGMKAKKEIEIGVLERTVLQDNELLRQAKVELQEIDQKLDKIPQTGIASLRLYRSVVINQKILEYVLPLYEQARINEQKDVPVILVLDKAKAPEKRFKPKRALIVAISCTAALLISLFVIALSEAADRKKKDSRIQEAFGGDFSWRTFFRLKK